MWDRSREQARGCGFRTGALALTAALCAGPAAAVLEIGGATIEPDEGYGGHHAPAPPFEDNSAAFEEWRRIVCDDVVPVSSETAYAPGFARMASGALAPPSLAPHGFTAAFAGRGVDATRPPGPHASGAGAMAAADPDGASEAAPDGGAAPGTSGRGLLPLAFALFLPALGGYAMDRRARLLGWLRRGQGNTS